MKRSPVCGSDVIAHAIILTDPRENEQTNYLPYRREHERETREPDRKQWCNRASEELASEELLAF